jgi:hypothetical protein
MLTGMAAFLALQQGLGSVVSELAHSSENFDPAKSKATLIKAFEASQDALDQTVRVCALQHQARRVNIVRGTKLGSTPFESELLAMPGNPNWLFEEGIQVVVYNVRAQKSAETHLSTNPFSFTPTKGPFRKTGQNNTWHRQSTARKW